eukprot:766865-Hanusia_phi.AAC.2
MAALEEEADQALDLHFHDGAKSISLLLVHGAVVLENADLVLLSWNSADVEQEREQEEREGNKRQGESEYLLRRLFLLLGQFLEAACHVTEL